MATDIINLRRSWARRHLPRQRTLTDSRSSFQYVRPWKARRLFFNMFSFTPNKNGRMQRRRGRIPARDERGARAGPPSGPMPARRAAHQPVASLVSAARRRGGRPSRAPAASPRVGLQPEEDEEHRGEQVAQRGEQLPRRCAPAGPESAMPTRNAPTAAETCSARARPATSTVRPEHLEQQHLRRLVERRRTARQRSRTSSTTSRTAMVSRRRRPAVAGPPKADAGQQRGEDRQVQRHRQVLEDQQRQHDRDLAVAEPAQVGEHLRGDAGRGDVGDAAHRHRRDRSPAEDQRDGDAGRGVEHEVDQAGRRRAAQRADQLRRRCTPGRA